MRLQRNLSPWLQLPCLLLFASICVAHTLQESLAVTLSPSQSVVESFQLTVPVVATTTTQVSMVTVTQMSMHTTTAMSTVTQLQTVTMAGTCAAIVEPAGTSSQLSVVTAGLNQIDSTSIAMPAMSISTTSASMVESSAAAPTVSPKSNVASGPCDCSCLCPMAAFPVVELQMAVNTSQAADSSSSQPSTFQTMASTSVADKVAAVSPSVSPSASSSAIVMTSPSTTPTALTLKSITGPLPSVIVTDTSTVQILQQKIQRPSFDINTYSLTTSVEVSVNFGRAVEPTARV